MFTATHAIEKGHNVQDKWQTVQNQVLTICTCIAYVKSSSILCIFRPLFTYEMNS